MKKKKKLIYNLLFTLCLIVFAYSGYRLISYYFEYKNMNDVYADISSNVVQDFTFDPETEDILSQAPEVDMQSLIDINPEIVGYILIPDTKISYPVAHSTDELKYLNYDIRGNRSRAGSIFIDPYDEPDFTEKSTIIHGHNMIDDSMFGSLNKYIDDETFFHEHPYIYVYTQDDIYLYRIFSATTVDAASDMYRFTFANYPAMMTYINERIEASVFTPELIPEETTNIITLSTCGSGWESARTVVQAYLMDKKSNTSN